VFDHPVGCSFAESFSILIDDRLLVVVCLSVIDQAFAVAFDLCEGCVFAVVESLLSGQVSTSSVSDLRSTVNAAAAVRADLPR
jgi:hypothetical protein